MLLLIINNIVDKYISIISFFYTHNLWFIMIYTRVYMWMYSRDVWWDFVVNPVLFYIKMNKVYGENDRNVEARTLWYERTDVFTLWARKSVVRGVDISQNHQRTRSLAQTQSTATFNPVFMICDYNVRATVFLNMFTRALIICFCLYVYCPNR